MSPNAIVAGVGHSRDWVDYLTLIVSFITLAVLGFYTYITFRLERHTRSALEETRRSNNATEESNKLTAESNRTQREALELGQRAWLVVDIGQPEENIIQLSVKNTGNTPATDLCIRHHLTIESSIPDHFTIKNSISETFLSAGATIFVPPFPVPKITNIQRRVKQENQGIFYCYCEIAYKDIFDKSRMTVMCWQYVFVPTSASDGEFFWAHVPKHTRLE